VVIPDNLSPSRHGSLTFRLSIGMSAQFGLLLNELLLRQTTPQSFGFTPVPFGLQAALF
jgi:hypothetical protein